MIVLAILAFTWIMNKSTSTATNMKTTNTDLNNEATTQAAASTTDASPSGGLKSEDLKVGAGKVVKKGDTVKINYVGTLTNGQKFDSSYDRNQPFETQIGVGQVIKGWDLGVVGMKVGGKRRLIIPSDLAYGSRGAGALIPPNSTLIFELELLDIK